MRKSIWNHRIPTFAAIVVIVGGIFITSYLVNKGVITVGRASSGTAPQHVTITNSTDTSFTVSYVTTQQTVGSLKYGIDSDISQNQTEQSVANSTPTYAHTITVSNLSAESSYSFTILSNGTEYKDEDGNPYNTATGIKLDQTQPKITKGTVVHADGSSATDTLILAKSEGSQALSTKTDSQGKFTLDLGQMRTDDLTSYNTFTDNTQIELSIYFGGDTATASFTAGTAEIPTITLSNEYEFLQTPTPVETASVSSELNTVDQLQHGTISIQFPKSNTNLTDQRPQFKGTALPGSIVKITIQPNSNPKAQISADADGIWTFRPPSNLSTGSHAITIETTDQAGTLTKVQTNFTIYAQGTQVDESATPSATVTPTRIESPTATVTPTPTVVGITTTPNPTATAIALPTPTLTPLVTQKPLPPTGTVSSTILLTFASVFSIITGSLILFF